MSIRVLLPGLLTTVQDLGRLGHQQFGVVVGGALDEWALRRANLLVRNLEHCAGLEMTLKGPTIRFTETALVALCGAPMSAHLGDAPFPQERPVFVAAGVTLDFGIAISGCRAYLAIAGGIDVPQVLGGHGTYLAAQLGGHHGRALIAGDELPIGQPRVSSSGRDRESTVTAVSDNAAEFRAPRWHVTADELAAVPSCCVLRVIRGVDYDRLQADSLEQLFSANYTVTAEFNRIGYRLQGPQLQLSDTTELLSSATCPGTVQVPPNGQPILLMADCATTGGYTRAAHVISTDMTYAAQLRPHDQVRFQPISLDEAHRLYHERNAYVMRLRQGIALKTG